MKPALRRLLSLFRAGLGLLLLYYVVVVRGEWHRIADLTSFGWLFASLVALSLVAAGVEAGRLSILSRAQGIRLAYRQAYWLVTVAGFFGYVIPGGTGGDVVRMYYLASANRDRGVEIVTLVLVDRAVGLYSMLLVILALVPFNQSLIAEHAVLRALVLAVLTLAVGMSIGAVLAGSAKVRTHRWYRAILDRLPFSRYAVRVAEALARSTAGRRRLLGAVVVSAAGNLVLAAAFVAASSVLVPAAGASTTSFLGLTGMLANALPITPGGLGVGEAAFEGLFGLAGLTGGAKLMLSWRAATLPLLVVGGLLYVRGRSRRASSAIESVDASTRPETDQAGPRPSQSPR